MHKTADTRMSAKCRRINHRPGPPTIPHPSSRQARTTSIPIKLIAQIELLVDDRQPTIKLSSSKAVALRRKCNVPLQL